MARQIQSKRLPGDNIELARQYALVMNAQKSHPDFKPYDLTPREGMAILLADKKLSTQNISGLQEKLSLSDSSVACIDALLMTGAEGPNGVIETIRLARKAFLDETDEKARHNFSGHQPTHASYAIKFIEGELDTETPRLIIPPKNKYRGRPREQYQAARHA
ncbi:hypothetical protein JW826_02425 [Candidatus Woesearchaeota archaeon]|nr:hypothetical protein [Candidatus Woesearchaeota archaeon]